jgi:hypothetical protein
MVHPRQTCNHPLLQLHQEGYHIFTNNINGSPGYLHSCLFTDNRELSNSLLEPLTDAVSCHCLMPINIVMITVGSREISLEKILGSVWHSDASQSIPVISLEVYSPSCWTPQKLLHEFNANLASHGVISLIHTYYINGERLCLNTIDTIHYRYFGKLFVVC